MKALQWKVNDERTAAARLREDGKPFACHVEATNRPDRWSWIVFKTERGAGRAFDGEAKSMPAAMNAADKAAPGAGWDLSLAPLAL